MIITIPELGREFLTLPGILPLVIVTTDDMMKKAKTKYYILLPFYQDYISMIATSFILTNNVEIFIFIKSRLSSKIVYSFVRVIPFFW